MATQVVALEASFNTSQAEGSVKSLKTQLKEAQAEVSKMADKFGDTSVQAANAARKAAELKDKIGDAKALTDAFNPDRKFNAFSTALQGVVGGFTAVQGAQALFGVKSEDLEKTLLRVQSAMALSQGINSIMEAQDSFKNLKIVAVSTFNAIKTAVGSTGIGVLVIAIGAVVTALMDYVDESSKVEDATKKMKEEEERYKTALENTTREIENRNNLIEYQLQLDLSNARGRGASLKELRKIEANYWTKKREDAQTDFTDAIDEVDRLKGLGYVKGALLDAANKDLETKRQTYYKTNQAYNLAIAKQNEEDYTKSKTTQDKKTEDKKNYAVSEVDIEMEKMQQILDSKEEFNAISKEIDDALYANEEQSSAQRIANAEAEAQIKTEILNNYVMSLGALSDLVGRQTAVGKGLALAQIAIETGLGYVRGLAIAQEGAKGTGPLAPYSFPIFYSTQVLAVLQAAAKAKSILSSVKGPGGGGGGNFNLPSNSPLTAPIQPQASSTTLNQMAINQASNQAIHAYVIESNVSGVIERIERIKRGSRVGP